MRTLTTDLGPVHVVATPDDAARCWEWLTPHRRAGTLLAWDGETTGGDPSPWHPDFRLRTAQISDGREAWVIQVEKPGMSEVARTVTREHPRWLAHFADNDIRFAARGIPGSVRTDSYAPHFMCSQVALAWYDPRTVTSPKKYGALALPRALKPSAHRVLRTSVLTDAKDRMLAGFRAQAPVHHRTPRKCATWGFTHIDVDDDDYLAYGGLDALVEHRLFHHCEAEVRRRGQGAGLDLDLLLQWHIDLMTLRGIPVDPVYVHWLDDQLEQVALSRMDLLNAHGVTASGQGRTVGTAFEALGCRSTRKTKEGNDSWDSEMLRIITDSAHLAETDGHRTAVELATGIRVVRKSGKFGVTYVKPMLDAARLDGRLHCSMRVVGTSTSRMSAERPGLQQIPKRHDKRIRASFAAPDGWVFVSGDYSKGEPWVMAIRSGDPALRADLEDGDFYSNVAVRTYGTLYDPSHKEDPALPGHQYYQNCKNGFMAGAYQCGVKKEAQLLRVSETEAGDVKDRWDRAYTVLKTHSRELDHQEAVVLESGWVAPLWDRWYVDRTGTPRCKGNKDSRLGLCYDTQGNLAVILRWALKNLIDQGLSWALNLIIHDEILLCVPETMADYALATLRKCMEIDFLGVVMRVDAKVCGRTWVTRDGSGYAEELERLVLNTDEE